MPGGLWTRKTQFHLTTCAQSNFHRPKVGPLVSGCDCGGEKMPIANFPSGVASTTGFFISPGPSLNGCNFPVAGLNSQKRLNSGGMYPVNASNCAETSCAPAGTENVTR